MCTRLREKKLPGKLPEGMLRVLHEIEPRVTQNQSSLYYTIIFKMREFSPKHQNFAQKFVLKIQKVCVNKFMLKNPKFRVKKY